MNRLGKMITLEQKFYAAQRTLEKAIEEKWPTGTKVFVRLNCNQINLTPGSVICGANKSYLRVRIDTAKENSSHSVRDVHFRNVVDA